MNVILPFVRGLYLCDPVIGYENEKTDLYGLFNSIHAPHYPHEGKRLCVFAQLAGGLGVVEMRVAIQYRPTEITIWNGQTHRLRIPTREGVVQFVLAINGCVYPQPGNYLVELYCNGVCIADVPLQLRLEEAEP